MIEQLLIVAGEASGDMHGAALITELKKIEPNLSIAGIGGSKMKAVGFKELFNIKDMAFLGFVEVIKHIPFIKKVRQTLLDYVEENKIKTVVLIDYPGFNLSLAKKLKKQKVKIIYYISPQIWAWGRGRIKKIKKLVDKMIVLFPFEKKFYGKHNFDVECVGHPLVEQISEYKFLSKEELYQKYDLQKDKEIILILPGSRNHEIEKILDRVLPAGKLLEEKYNMQIVIASAENIDESIFKNFNIDDCKIIKGNTYDFYKHAKFGIIKSGTSTLEAGLIGLPFVVVYYTNKFTYSLGKLLVKIKNIALVNIVAEKNIVTELIQKDITTENIVLIGSKLISDENETSVMKNNFKILQTKLGEKGASEKTAKIIVTELNEY